MTPDYTVCPLCGMSSFVDEDENDFAYMCGNSDCQLSKDWSVSGFWYALHDRIVQARQEGYEQGYDEGSKEVD